MIAALVANSFDLGAALWLGAAQTGSEIEPGPLEPVIDRIVEIGVLLLVTAIMMCLFRMLRGPHLADRVLSVEIMALNVVGVVILLSIYLASAAFLDVALVVAIIGFTSVIAFAQYIDAMRRRREQRRRARQEQERRERGLADTGEGAEEGA